MDSKKKSKNTTSAADTSFKIQAKHVCVIYCYVNDVGMESVNSGFCWIGKLIDACIYENNLL